MLYWQRFWWLSCIWLLPSFCPFRQLEFDNLEGFRQAQRTIVRHGRLGGRFLKLDRVKSTKPSTNSEKSCQKALCECTEFCMPWQSHSDTSLRFGWEGFIALSFDGGCLEFLPGIKEVRRWRHSQCCQGFPGTICKLKFLIIYMHASNISVYKLPHILWIYHCFVGIMFD